MDLHALSQGRSMLVVRGCLAFLIGVIAGNNSSLTTEGAATLLGLWTLAEGAALVRQAYPATGTTRRAEPQPALLALGGTAVVVGALAVLAPGLSGAALIWVLALWFVVRALAEATASSGAIPNRSRIYLGLSAVVDLGLAAVLMTHTSGSAADLVLFGGALAAFWGLLQLGVAACAVKSKTEDVAGRLLAPR